MSENHKIIIFLIVVFTLVLFLLGLFFFVLFQKFHKNIQLKQQESMRNLVIGQDNERTRIARDLHDSLNPELSTVSVSYTHLDVYKRQFYSSTVHEGSAVIEF